METVTRKLPKALYKMATAAWHKHLKWEMSMDEPDICCVKEEDDQNYYGVWLCGIGAIDVQFPKETTRDLTEAEAEQFSCGKFSMCGLRWGYTKNELLNRV